MTWVAAALLCAAPVQDVGSAPKEIQAEGWLNTEGPVSLKDLVGRVVVVEFWATWCPPCINAIPHIIETRNRFSIDQVVMISLSDEPEKTVAPFVKQKKMNYWIGWGSKTAKEYAVAGLPHAVIIAPDGKVAWTGFPVGKEFTDKIAVLAETVEDLRDERAAKAFGDAFETAKAETKPVLLFVKAVEAKENGKVQELLDSKILKSTLQRFVTLEYALDPDLEAFKKLGIGEAPRLLVLDPRAEKLEDSVLAAYDDRLSTSQLKAFLKKWDALPDQ